MQSSGMSPGMLGGFYLFLLSIEKHSHVISKEMAGHI